MSTELTIPLKEALEAAKASPRINAMERLIAASPQLEIQPVHRFTPGLYIRELTMPKGALFTSKIHKTEHPFIVSKGRCKVYTESAGVEEIVAPYFGITKAATRRVLLIEEETTWTTFHPTTLTDLKAIEEAIIEPHVVGGELEMSGQPALREGIAA